MKKRLGLALALLKKPELLILDEPTNRLDPVGVYNIWDIIKMLPAEFNTTIFFSSHNLTEVEQLATHVGIMANGKLLFHGTLEGLQVQKQAYARVELDKPVEAKKILLGLGWKVSQVDKQILKISIRDKSDTGKINSFLNKKGFNIYEVIYEHPSLDEMFLHFKENGDLKSE